MLPFEKYLTLDENQSENASVVDLPDYAKAPDFCFNLSIFMIGKKNSF
jgi:hypothetical protein